MKVLRSAIRFGLAAVFVVSGGLKLANVPGLLDTIADYRILAPAYAAALAVYLPWLEMAAGFALLCAPLVSGAALLILGLDLLFGAALASAWYRQLDIACGCFGRFDFDGVPGGMVRDALILLAAIVLLLAPQTDRCRVG